MVVASKMLDSVLNTYRELLKQSKQDKKEVEKDKYIKKLMEKYNIYDSRELHKVITNEEYNKLIKLQLRAVRGA